MEFASRLEGNTEISSPLDSILSLILLI